MSNHFSDGLSKNLKAAGAPRTPDGGLATDTGLLNGLMIGTVMDDQDEQRSGRIWVSIPGVTSRQVNSPNAEPHWRGTVPDRRSGRLEYDPELRRNWILCQPMFGSMGSDMCRADYTVDGRNSTRGDVVSYGDWSQPRIGDYVGVLFMGGDPNVAFYIGCVGKPNQGRMIPGNPGYNSKKIVDGVDEKEKTKPSVAIPGYDNDFGSSTITDKEGKVVEREDESGKVPDHTSGRNNIYGGLAYDQHRGPGTSSMKRESPSYVRGMKTPGWNFETERFNTNADGGQFNDSPGKYRYVNTTGHQFVMDDHPDHQLIRLRTSNGCQILMNDSGEHAYLYVNTPKGNVWMEMCDDGKIYMYSADGFALHSKEISITADKNINMEALKDINMIARENFRLTVGKETHWAFNGDFKSIYAKAAHHTYLEDFFLNVQKTCNTTIGKNYLIKCDQSVSLGAKEKLVVMSSEGVYMDGTKLVSMEGTNIYLNSGMVAETTDPEKAEKPKFPELSKKDAPPSKEEIVGDQDPPKVKYLAPSVPQHQPWNGCSGSSTSGTTGRVSPYENPNVSQAVPGLEFGGIPMVSGDATDQRRLGAACSTSSYPDEGVGTKLNSWTETNLNPINLAIFSAGLLKPDFVNQNRRDPNQAGIWVPTANYQTDSIQERPQLKLHRLLKPGEIAPVDSYKCTDFTKEFIKNNEKLMQIPEVHNGALFVGRGHEVQVGDTIDGIVITSDIYNTMIAGGVTSTMIFLDPNEADALFEDDILVYENYIRSHITVNITQGQFDALVSFAYHDQAILNPRGATTNVIYAINAGRNDIAQELMSQNVYVDGKIEPNVVLRRQQERNIFNTLPNDNLEARGTWEPNTENTVTLGDFVIQEQVRNAILFAADTNRINRAFMFAMAAQESGFDPNAFNTSGGNFGLFQFPPELTNLYDLAEKPYDPIQNSNAAGLYMKESIDFFRETNGNLEPDEGDLYVMMFLGQDDGAAFNKITRENPNGSVIEAINSLTPGLVDVLPTIFKKYDGTARTNRQVYDFLANIMKSRVLMF